MLPRCSATSRALWSRLMPLNRGLSNQRWSSATSSSIRAMRSVLLPDDEVGVVGDAGSVLLEAREIVPDPGAGPVEIFIVQVQVQEVDVPGRLDPAQHVVLGDLAGDRQRRLL